MKGELKTVYECAHCRKWYKMKHHALWHELHCKENPLNKHKCFEFCEHLKSIDGEVECDYYDGISYKYRIFECEITGEEMHSYIAERRKLEVVNGTKRMPCECDDYKSMGVCGK